MTKRECAKLYNEFKRLSKLLQAIIRVINSNERCRLSVNINAMHCDVEQQFDPPPRVRYENHDKKEKKEKRKPCLREDEREDMTPIPFID